MPENPVSDILSERPSLDSRSSRDAVQKNDLEAIWHRLGKIFSYLSIILPRPAAAARQLRSLGDGGRLPPKGPPAARRTRAATYLNNQLRLQPNYFNFNFFILNLVFVILNFFFNSAS